MLTALSALAGLGLACSSPASELPVEPAAQPPGASAPAPQGPPMPFEPPVAVTAVRASGLEESSGLAPSSRHPGTWWTINDSGNPSELFRFDLAGALLGRHPVPGVDNRDWEDLAAGPCPDRPEPCLYIAEIGDNKRQYDHVAVYAAREPEAGEAAVVVSSWRARYPQGARNAESLLRDPITGLLYLITKHKSGRSEVYRFPAEPGDELGTLTLVAELQLEGSGWSALSATGGDFSPDGARVILRTYQVAWEWDVHADAREAHWAEPPRRAWLAAEEQGESVAYLPGGGLLTTSEGSPMKVNAVPRTGQDPPLP
jgi:hypothetical protein